MSCFGIEASAFVGKLRASDEIVKHGFVVLSAVGASGGIGFPDPVEVLC